MEKENLCDKVYRHVYRLLFNGELKGGDRVPEEGIAEQLGVSRTPIREALRRLAQEGLVTIYPRRYAEITRFDRESLEKLGLIRIELLSLAARLAIWKGSNSDFDELREAAEWYDRAEGAGDFQGCIRADEAFYRGLARIGGNGYLQDILNQLSGKVRFVQISRALEGEGAPAAPAEHREILEGLTARDAGAVQEALRRHLGSFYGIEPQLLDS